MKCPNCSSKLYEYVFVSDGKRAGEECLNCGFCEVVNNDN